MGAERRTRDDLSARRDILGKKISESKFKYLIQESVEDIALARALREGKNSEITSKTEILKLLGSKK